MFKGDPSDILTATNFAAHSLSYLSQYFLHSPALDKAIAVMLASLLPSTNIRDVGAGGPGFGFTNKDLLREVSLQPPHPHPPVKGTSQPPQLGKCSAVPEYPS